MQKRVKQLKCTKPPPRHQLLIHKKSKNIKTQKDFKNPKTQKEQNLQKEQQNTKIALSRQLRDMRGVGGSKPIYYSITRGGCWREFITPKGSSDRSNKQIVRSNFPFSDAPYYVRGVSTYQENPYPHLFCFNNNTTYLTNLKPGRFGENQKE